MNGRPDWPIKGVIYRENAIGADTCGAASEDLAEDVLAGMNPGEQKDRRECNYNRDGGETTHRE